jgi:uncharacterized protein
MDGDAILKVIGACKELPREAIEASLANVEAVAPGVLAVVEAAADGRKLSPEEENVLFYGIHILGAAGYQKLFAPAMRLLRLPDDDLDALLGDVVTLSFPKVLIGSFDGDAETLFDFITDETREDVLRGICFEIVAYLTWKGRIDAARTRALIERFDDDRLAEGEEFVWSSWGQVVELLGWRDLAPRVEAAHRDGRITPEFSRLKDFHAGLAKAEKAAPGDERRFTDQHLCGIEDIFEVLARYNVMEDPGFAEPEDDYPPVQMPVHNPMRHVGRNDPCPCGSGKKYKKCCLAVA